MLTERQQQVLDYLRRAHRRTGIVPSTREIQQHFGFSSQTAAMSLLRALEAKGAIRRRPGKARAVTFTDQEDDGPLMEIPVFGGIAAGFAQEAFPEAERYLSADPETLGISRRAKVFALRVRGDSMIGAHIADGDHVVLECREPKDGDVVAALIDGETTLKRYKVRRGQAHLKAENRNYPELYPREGLEIQGVMVALLRRVK